MANENQETESKFWVNKLGPYEKKLLELQASLVETRAFESNIRFDTVDNLFTKSGKVLRLRKYHDNRLTYKGPSQRIGGALSREEIETVVKNHENMRLILHSIGFEERAIYEKYRTMYSFRNCLITLDELPYGNFIEIEGLDFSHISSVAIELGINPDRAIPASYQNIFEQLRDHLNLKARNLIFSESELEFLDLSMLGYSKADQS